MAPLPFSDDPILSDLASYWLARRGERSMPDRRDIDPLHMPRQVLPHLALLELTADSRFRFRLVGTEVVSRLGFNPVGRLVSDVFRDAYRNYMEGALEMTAREQAPVYCESNFLWDPGGVMHTRRLLLPLRHGDGLQILLGRTWQQNGRALGRMEPQIVALADSATVTQQVIDFRPAAAP